MFSPILIGRERHLADINLETCLSRLAATQIDQISEVMSNQWHEQNARMNDMVWSSKSLLEDGFIRFVKMLCQACCNDLKAC